MAIPRPLPAVLLKYVLITGLWGAPALWSQEPTPKSGTSPPPNSATSSRESVERQDDPLRILWLKNPATGELVPVPGLTIDEYDKLDRIRRGLPPAPSTPPNFVITDLKLTANIKGTVSASKLALEIELRDDQWARIPLGLVGAVPHAAPSEENWLVTPDPDSEGFLLWAKGRPGDKKSLKLAFDYPVVVSAESSKCKIALPRARASSATITIESGEIIPQLDGSGTINASKFASGVTELVCSGFVSGLDLVWRTKSSPRDNTHWLESTGAVEVRVDGRRQIRADAKFRIRAFGSMVQSLRIRLPAGMRLSPDAAQISPFIRSHSISSEVREPTTLNRQVVELVIDPAAPSDFEIRIQAESDGPVANETANLAIDGFEILGAKRHLGLIDLFLTPDWFVAAGQSPAIRRIDVDQSGTVDSNFLRARFEYSAQPAVIQITARLPRTLVEPSYDIFLEASQARLEGTLKYRFRGPSTGRIEIDLADWELERIESPDSAFLIEDSEQNGSRLIIPLSPQPRPAGAESTLRLELRRLLPDAKPQLRLPYPTASLDATAIVRVFSDVNLEITPRASEFKGVSTDAVTPSSTPQLRGQFAYRTRPGGEQPLLSFDIQVRRQLLLLDLKTQLVFHSLDSISVEHAMRINVAYEPLRELVVELPFPASELNTARVLLDELPVERSNVVENDVPDESGLIWTTCRYNLPRSYLGPLNFTIQFPFEVPQPKEGAAKFALPLPRLISNSPVQSKPHQLILRDASRRIQVDAADWSRDLFAPTGEAANSERFFSLKQRTQVLMTISDASRQLGRGNRCERMWLQTTLSAKARNDRFCVRMSSWSAPMRIRLPEGLVASSVTVAVDGEEPEFEHPTASRTEVVILPPRANANDFHVVEIWYQCESNPLQWGTELLLAPEIVGIETRERRFWQLLTPPDWYSILSPAGWTMEQTGGMKNWLWSSSVRFNQGDLEKWVGATKQIAPPAEFNKYLFSVQNSRTSMGLVLAPRREVWLLGLGLAFLIGLTLLYVRWLRRPISLLSLASAAALILIIQPHWSEAVTQFFITGGAATVMVWLLRSLLGPSKAAFSRTSPSRSGARALETAALPNDSQSAPRRGSSISNAAAARPAS